MCCFQYSTLVKWLYFTFKYKVVIQKISSSLPDLEFLWFDKDKPENNLNRKFERWDHNTRSCQNRKKLH